MQTSLIDIYKQAPAVEITDSTTANFGSVNTPKSAMYKDATGKTLSQKGYDIQKKAGMDMS
jgi:hypothetical protein